MIEAHIQNAHVPIKLSKQNLHQKECNKCIFTQIKKKSQERKQKISSQDLKTPRTASFKDIEI